MIMIKAARLFLPFQSLTNKNSTLKLLLNSPKRRFLNACSVNFLGNTSTGYQKQNFHVSSYSNFQENSETRSLAIIENLKQKMDKFKGKRALVTGASQGIGRAIAVKLAELGAEVFAVARNEESLKDLEKENSNITAITLDVCDWDQTRKTVESIRPIHLLVNNAGTSRLATALEATQDQFDFTFNLNVKSIMNITQVVAKDLIERKEGGRVVNLSSIAGQRALFEHLTYCSSKAALDMLTKGFALELGPHNIRVNAVSPTVVLTELGIKAWSDPVKAHSIKSRIPQGHFAEVKDVVNAVVYLLSDESDMINGQALAIDGGFNVW